MVKALVEEIKQSGKPEYKPGALWAINMQLIQKADELDPITLDPSTLTADLPKKLNPSTWCLC